MCKYLLPARLNFLPFKFTFKAQVMIFQLILKVSYQPKLWELINFLRIHIQQISVLLSPFIYRLLTDHRLKFLLILKKKSMRKVFISFLPQFYTDSSCVRFELNGSEFSPWDHKSSLIFLSSRHFIRNWILFFSSFSTHVIGRVSAWNLL